VVQVVQLEGPQLEAHADVRVAQAGWSAARRNGQLTDFTGTASGILEGLFGGGVFSYVDYSCYIRVMIYIYIY
jgi:hypothetical protein